MFDTAFYVIVLGCLLAAIVNAAFATGGVYIMLLASSSVLPISHAIPLQSVFAVGSLTGRLYYFWKYIDWPLFRAFVLGSLVGVFLGTQAFVSVPEKALLVMLGITLLVLIWAPRIPWRIPLKQPFFLVGIVHSFLGALLGVGGILQPLVLRTKLTKFQVTGTLAACMFTLDIMKAIGYISVGFDYLQYIPHIVGATLAGFAGTYIGKSLTHRVSEDLFRTVFKLLVSIAAIRFIVEGFTF